MTTIYFLIHEINRSSLMDIVNKSMTWVSVIIIYFMVEIQLYRLHYWSRNCHWSKLLLYDFKHVYLKYISLTYPNSPPKWIESLSKIIVFLYFPKVYFTIFVLLQKPYSRYIIKWDKQEVTNTVSAGTCEVIGVQLMWNN